MQSTGIKMDNNYIFYTFTVRLSSFTDAYNYLSKNINQKEIEVPRLSRENKQDFIRNIEASRKILFQFNNGHILASSVYFDEKGSNQVFQCLIPLKTYTTTLDNRSLLVDPQFFEQLKKELTKETQSRNIFASFYEGKTDVISIAYEIAGEGKGVNNAIALLDSPPAIFGQFHGELDGNNINYQKFQQGYLVANKATYDENLDYPIKYVNLIGKDEYVSIEATDMRRAVIVNLGKHESVFNLILHKSVLHLVKSIKPYLHFDKFLVAIQGDKAILEVNPFNGEVGYRLIYDLIDQQYPGLKASLEHTYNATITLALPAIIDYLKVVTKTKGAIVEFIYINDSSILIRHKQEIDKLAQGWTNTILNDLTLSTQNIADQEFDNFLLDAQLLLDAIASLDKKAKFTIKVAGSQQPILIQQANVDQFVMPCRPNLQMQ
jgi:hypothetical protein